MFMNLICWVAVGLIAGLIASKIVNEHGDDPKLGIALGALGAALGGFLHGVISTGGVANFNGRTLWGAAFGAAVALVAWHVTRARSTHATFRNRR
jgi:uncharacterized membrane protein YeaQ/YmgE (transglycosylase-associated protein family)